MVYPSRGAWRFYDLDRASEFWPRLSGVGIVAEHPTGLATLDCDVVLEGVNAGLVFDVEDECYVTFRGERIWAGHLKGHIEDSPTDVGPQVLVLSGQDYTAKLDDVIIRRRKKRKKESVRRRVKWLLKQMRSNIWSFASTDLSGLPAGNPDVEAYDYFGSTLREALDHVAAEVRLFFYVDLDNVFHIFRTDLYDAPFDLDNVSPDLAATFPFREWEHETDSTELANAFLVEPEKRPDSRWSRDGASVAAYGRQERFISDSSLGGPIAAGNVGARAIAEYADPAEESRLICWEPGLFPGQKVHVVEGLWGHDFDRIVERVEIRAVDPHDDAGEAYLESTVTLTDRRRAKVGGGGGGGGGKGKDKTTKDQPVDTTPHKLDDFDRVVAPPTISAGAAVAAISVAGQMRAGRTHNDPFSWFGPTWHPGAVGDVQNFLGSWYGQGAGRNAAPAWAPCSGMGPVFTGYRETESWYKLTVSAWPADAAGIEVTFASGSAGGVQGPGYGEVAPIEVVALSYEPDDMRLGTVLGELMPGVSKTLTVPMGSVPADGSVLYIGYRTKWEANAKAGTYDWACGWTWPYMCHSYDVDNHGDPYCGYSGEVGVVVPTGATWQVWDAAEADLGAIASPSSAPWEGGNAWQDAGSEGNGDAWGMDGEALYITTEEASGKGIYLVGKRDDDDEPEGPWSDMGWAQDVHFTIDVHGDTAASGLRHIESTTTGEGESSIGTVHIGDLLRDEGISVAGPTVVDYAAKALTLGKEWRARFDTRSGLYVRGKLWLASDGMPAGWDVQAVLAQTDDDADRWTLWLRAGNGVGAEQTVRVLKTRALAGGVPGQRIVKEYIGIAGGLERDFHVAHPYRPATLRAYVNGIGVAPSTTDGAESAFGLDFWPTARSVIRATYVIAE